MDIPNKIGHLKGKSGFHKCESAAVDTYLRLIVLSAGPSAARNGPSHLYPEPECRIPREIVAFRAYFGLRGSEGTRDANLRRISQIVVGAERKLNSSPHASDREHAVPPRLISSGLTRVRPVNFSMQ